MFRIVDVGRDRHLVRWELHEEGFQSRVNDRWKTVFVYQDVKIVTSLSFTLVDQDTDVVDTTKAFGLFEVTAALDSVKKLIIRHSLHNARSFSR